MTNEFSERRDDRTESAILREERKFAAGRFLTFCVAFAVSIGMFYISIGEHALWPLVVWTVCVLGFGAGMLISMFEYFASWPPREIVEMVSVEAMVDEPESRLIVSIGPNSLGVSRLGLKPTQWRALADSLFAARYKWNRKVLQGTGNWGNLTVGTTYPDLVSDWEKLNVVKGRWKGEGDNKKLLSAILLPAGWDAIQKHAGTDYAKMPASPAPGSEA
jgi:hypothetical protein